MNKTRKSIDPKADPKAEPKSGLGILHKQELEDTGKSYLPEASQLDKAIELLLVVKRRYKTGLFNPIAYNGKNIDLLPSYIDNFLKDVGKHE